MTLAVLLIAGFVLAAAALPRRPPHGQCSRVLGGENAVVADYPWQVSIEVFGHFDCAGVIVKENYVATTASCANHGVDELTVRSGSSLREKDGVVLDVDKIVPHEKWIAGSTAYDIAVLRVKEPFVFNEYCAQAELYTADEVVSPGTEGEVVGWGQGRDSSQIQMQRAKFKTVDPAECDTVLEEGQACLTAPGKSACVGDTGSPFIVGRRIAGLVADGFACNTTVTNYIVITDIPSYRDWIDEHAAY